MRSRGWRERVVDGSLNRMAFKVIYSNGVEDEYTDDDVVQAEYERRRREDTIGHRIKALAEDPDPVGGPSTPYAPSTPSQSPPLPATSSISLRLVSTGS